MRIWEIWIRADFHLLQTKMGSEEFNELFDNFDNCYDIHTDYIIHLDNELSYMPDGKVQREFRIQKNAILLFNTSEFSKSIRYS